MKGSENIIATLNKLLLGEWQAIRQYSAVEVVFHVMGYQELAEQYQDRVKDEKKHSHKIQKRIVKLGGEITADAEPKPVFAGDIKDQINASLAIEKIAVSDYRAAIKEAETESDYGTADILRSILHGDGSEESHIREIESDIAQIEAEGLQTWLSTQR